MRPRHQQTDKAQGQTMPARVARVGLAARAGVAPPFSRAAQAASLQKRSLPVPVVTPPVYRNKGQAPCVFLRPAAAVPLPFCGKGQAKRTGYLPTGLGALACPEPAGAAVQLANMAAAQKVRSIFAYLRLLVFSIRIARSFRFVPIPPCVDLK